jgi:hypothetical protein
MPPLDVKHKGAHGGFSATSDPDIGNVMSWGNNRSSQGVRAGLDSAAGREAGF